MGRSARVADALWAVPGDFFRAAIVFGGAGVLLLRVVSLALTVTTAASPRTVIVTTIEEVLYGLGIVALAGLAAFALARTVLRPVLYERVAPPSTRDTTLRTRFLVASTGAAFATAGVLLDVLVDFEHTSDSALAGYLMSAAALVALAAAIGWLVGDDTARGIATVSARLRELADRGSAKSDVPRFAADEIGELAAAATELERRLRRADAAAAAARERERIARELHDGVAKSVSVLALEAATIARQAPEALRPELARLERLARLLSEELRAIVTEVRSAGDGEPFRQALLRATGRYRGAKIEVDGEIERIGTLARFEILRIVEEGLRNAERHARATEVVARVAVHDERVRLEIEDDGQGIEEVDLQELAYQGRFGLIGIRERIELLRGSLAIERRAPGGTLVRIELPLAGG